MTTHLQDVPDVVLDRWVTDAAAAAAARGVVGVVDFEMVKNLVVWPRRFANGFDKLRIAAGIYTAFLDEAIAAGARTGDIIDGTGGLLSVGPFKIIIDGTGGLLSVGPFKIIIDGSLNTRTAWCVEKYQGMSGGGVPLCGLSSSESMFGFIKCAVAEHRE
ncbi:hypothetical protein GCM10027052_11190 [Parafrigoribacterium mesophilum]